MNNPMTIITLYLQICHDLQSPLINKFTSLTFDLPTNSLTTRPKYRQ